MRCSISLFLGGLLAFGVTSGFARAELTWEIETVDSTGTVGLYTSLALDGSDNPHISYFDITNDDLKYVYWDGDSWEGLGGSWTVDSAGKVGSYTSLGAWPQRTALHQLQRRYSLRPEIRSLEWLILGYL